MKNKKVRYVVKGFSDHEKLYMVIDSSTLRVSSMRMVLSVAAIVGFRLFSHDVTQAYLQIKSHLTRKVFILPKKKDMEVLGLKEGEMFEIVRPLYRLCDAGNYWGETMMTQLTNDRNMRQTDGGAALYYHHDGEKLKGIAGMYVDDLLYAGTQYFQEHSQNTLMKFDCNPRFYDEFDFFDAQINKLEDGSFMMSQRYYARTIKPAGTNGSFEEFRRER